MTENWRPIPGYEGLYDVSDHGRIRSWSTHRGMTAPHEVKTALDHHGYPKLTLYRAGRRDYRTVHGLVALAFLGPRPDGQEVRHLDGDPLHRHLRNLAYGTKTQNQQDTIRHGRHHHAAKTRCRDGHEYDEANTSVTRSGARECRRCRARQQRERRARRALRPADTTGRTVAA